jgi:hypothetical protein
MLPIKSPDQSAKGGVPQHPFAKGCKIALLIWLLGVLIPLNLWWSNHTQYGATRIWTLCFPNADFSQYYLAGTAARYGLWMHLYPHFKSEWADKPGRKIWFSEYAEADPELLEKVSGIAEEPVLNIAPPPQALLCLPLAYFPINVAFKIWMTGLILASLGTAACMVTIFRRLGGTSGYVAGAFYLAGAFLPLLPRIGAGDNAMMFLVLCVGVAALAWADDRPFLLGAGLILPAVFKGLTASWCPLLLFKPVKWQALGWLAVWTILLNGLVLWWGGIHPYKTWIQDILPNAQSMEIQQAWLHCMNLKGIAYRWGWESFPASVMKGLNLAGLLAVYFGFWKQGPCRGRAALANLCAALVAALVIFNLCNAVSWLPYIAFLLPFAGWAAVEYGHSAPPEKRRFKVLAGFLFLAVPGIHLAFSRFILKDAQAMTNAGRDLYLGVELCFLGLAYRRLYRAVPPTTGSASPDGLRQPQ